MKNKHRIKQGLSLLLAGGIALTNLGAALPAFAEDAAATPETASAATPETAEANVPTPNLSQITENLYNDLPDAPTGSYLGSMGLPVATGETKIGISAWVSDLYDGVDAHMDADALNADENTVTIGKTPGTDYAIVPLLAQVEYPADGAVSEIILPDGVELLSYLSTDYEPIPADEQEQTEILHQTYSEQLAAATGLYAMSGATLRQYKHDAPWRSVHYLALGGLNHQPIDYFLQQYPEVKRVALCFDRDEPGRNFTKIVAKRLTERGYIVQDTPPAIGKDYNDYLLAARRLISMER